MTNAEKYLKDNVSVEEFIKSYLDFSFSRVWEKDENSFDNITKKFFEQLVKPTLTEDERVILRNIEFKDYNIIGRKESGELYVNYQENDSFNGTWFIMFKKHLFQFIKERRRILY